MSGTRYDGHDADALARRLGVPRVLLYDSIGSTLDVAQQRAAGLPDGTLILADEQTAGRGRMGRAWASARGAGIWLTLVERPRDVAAHGVLALRCGLAAGRALASFSEAPVMVKWPNDLLVAGGKLAGVLIESRWQGDRPEWVAIGMGVNVVPPPDGQGAGLGAGVDRVAVLAALVPALRTAARAEGLLDAGELDRWSGRDALRGRRVTSPGEGIVAGVAPDGALLIADAEGTLSAYHAGTVTLAEPLACS